MFLFSRIQQIFSFQSHPIIGKGMQQTSFMNWHELAALWEIPAVETELLLHNFLWMVWILTIPNFAEYRKKSLKRTSLNMQNIEFFKWSRGVLLHVFFLAYSQPVWGVLTLFNGVFFLSFTLQSLQCFPLSCHSCALTWWSSEEDSKVYLVE